MEKNTFIKLLVCLGILFLPLASVAQTPPPADNGEIDFYQYNIYGWGIRDFHSDININEDSTFTVKETILADFTKAQNRHGIIRDLPIHYKDNNNQNLNLRFTLIGVTDEAGNPYEVATSYVGDDVEMKIGSGDILVDGKLRTYIISYRLARGINQFEDNQELYWNVTGNGWDTAIAKASATITLPKETDQKLMKTICYTGFGYSKEQDCQARVIDGKTYQFSSNFLLPTSAGLTVVASFPKGTVNFPSPLTVFLWFILDNWGYLIPVFTFCYLYYLWYKHGRDPKATHSAIMPEYDIPDQLRPAEIGTLLDDRVDMQDITSTIIDLATRGYLKIIESKEKKMLWGETTSYELEKTTPKNPDKDPLQGFETKIYNAIFGSSEKISLGDLKYKFYKDIPGIKTAIYDSLINKKYYTSNPETARASYFGCGGGLFFVTIFFLGFLSDINLPLFLGLLLSAPLIFIFGFFMPQRTQKGADTQIRILGLEEFIKTAETDRVKFYEKENIFEKILPYAIAFGIADRWAKACEGLYKTQPNWYQSSDPNMLHHFNTYYFLHTLNSFNSSMTSNMVAAPRSSASGGHSGFGGGGFSGGGFGGGGGSSW
jgi:uncharacterized membrane protein